ncbi:MAG: signal peptidase I [Theionarchaea archaeon]|nr:signal peptidase I [Theionarchaea archaeon]MBU6999132.1 signal peptidase I [Theionarchaea archaeon]MBU7019493.1 signal peptidase I [Theionarchaea archaeon]MBU7040793.1 signal peptidase I [Theionarchaea archaeon]
MSSDSVRKNLIDIAIALCIFLVIQGALYGVLGVFPPYRVVSSGSMEPTYYEGDIVFIKQIDPHKLQVGDIIVFRPKGGGIPIVHRVTEIVEESQVLYFVTQGDHNAFPDSFYRPLPGVPESEVIGTPVLKIPKVGYVSVFFRRLL